MHWKSGAQIVQYEMWGRGISTVRPVTVVDDVAAHIALYSHPGTRIVTRVIENRYSLSVPERIGLYIQMLDPSLGELRDVTTSGNHVLTLTRPNSWHSVWLFWSPDWQFKTWYVNFQSPLRRLRRGVKIHDYALDIVVRPDMSWSWKDVEEFEELIDNVIPHHANEPIFVLLVLFVVVAQKYVVSTGHSFCSDYKTQLHDAKTVAVTRR